MYRDLARFLAVTLLAGTLHAAMEPMSLRSNELSGAILNKNVIVDLKDGWRVKAIVKSVQPSGLAISVPKEGEVSISREQIARLQLVKMRARGRIIGTTIGALLGLSTGLLVASTISFGGNSFSSSTHRDSAAFAAGAGLGVGAIAAGHLIGKRTDRQEILIKFLPD